MRVCAESFGMKALRLVPAYHRYDLLQPEVVDFARAAAGLVLVITIPHRIVDVRQRQAAVR